MERLARLIREFRYWLADTSNLIHLSALVFGPLVVVAVIEVGILSHISYFLFPPLASATFTIFYEPESRYASFSHIVFGLTLGAVAGWLSYTSLGFNGVSVGAALVLTGILTWVTSTEHPSAFSASLLAVVLRTESVLYIPAVFLSSLALGTFFYVWRTRFFERRAEYLYESTWSDDHVLVPFREPDESIAELAASIAGAHEGGRVVMVDIVTGDESASDISGFEDLADRLRQEYGIAADVAVVEVENVSPQRIDEMMERYDSDLVVLPWQQWDEGFVEQVLDRPADTVLVDDAVEDGFEDALLPVEAVDGDTRLAVDLALRLVDGGPVSVSHRIDDEHGRRDAEKEVLDLVDGFSGTFETRVVNPGNADWWDRVCREAQEYDALLVTGVDADGEVVDTLRDGCEAPLLLVDADQEFTWPF